MKNIFVPTTKTGEDWQRLLGNPEQHWKKGYSAMTAASCWEASQPVLPREITKVLDAGDDAALSGLELLAAFPEWKVPLPGGKAPSQTDILAITRNEIGLVILAVEAKVDESFNQMLKEKETNASTGQDERITFLKETLKISGSFEKKIRYQLLHRTVSAFLTARKFHAHVAVMLVHSFSPTSKWREDLNEGNLG